MHLHGGFLSASFRDILGDALWAAMIFWLVSAVAPEARLAARALVTVALCGAVELSQLVHTPFLDALRRPTIGHLILGSDFDARDLAAYAAGVAAAASIAAAAFRRSRAT